MANTADLIALQAEYPTAFADPESAPPVTTPPETTGTVLGEAITAELKDMEPDQVRDFVEGHLRAQTEPDEECRTGETPQLCGNMDAQVWAKEFVERLKDPSFLADGDEVGTMLGWFANAIMTGYDVGYSQGVSSSNEPVSESYSECQYHLDQLKDNPKLLSVAVSFLKKLTDIADLDNAAASKKYHEKAGGLPTRPLSHVVDEVSAPILVDLPETHARQGSAECPGGLCDL